MLTTLRQHSSDQNQKSHNYETAIKAICLPALDQTYKFLLFRVATLPCKTLSHLLVSSNRHFLVIHTTTMGSTPVSRPRTPSKSSAHGVPAVPPIPVEEQQAPRSRRSSFSFLHRGKSIERLNSNRSVSGGKLSKKQNKEQELQRAREAAAIPMQPPKIPALLPQGQLQSFGGENGKSESRYAMSGQKGGFVRGRNNDLSRSNSHGVPIPPMPGSENSAYVDPYARTESMTNRGRYSYASSAVSTINSPRRVRRRKDPTPFK